MCLRVNQLATTTKSYVSVAIFNKCIIYVHPIWTLYTSLLYTYTTLFLIVHAAYIRALYGHYL